MNESLGPKKVYLPDITFSKVVKVLYRFSSPLLAPLLGGGFMVSSYRFFAFPYPVVLPIGWRILYNSERFTKKKG